MTPGRPAGGQKQKAAAAAPGGGGGRKQVALFAAATSPTDVAQLSLLHGHRVVFNLP